MRYRKVGFVQFRIENPVRPFGMGYVSTAQAAAILGISTRRVRVLLEKGKLAGRKIGRDWILDRQGVEGRKRMI
jgi:excisionase family DNA binding protein